MGLVVFVIFLQLARLSGKAMAKTSKRLKKTCLVCGKKITVYSYPDHTMRGGHYFGKMPLYTKKELDRADKGGTRKKFVGDWEMNVMIISPKPYGHAEYWECPTCYRGK